MCVSGKEQVIPLLNDVTRTCKTDEWPSNLGVNKPLLFYSAEYFWDLSPLLNIIIFFTGQYITLCKSQIISSSFNQYCNYFQFLAIMNKNAMNILYKAVLWAYNLSLSDKSIGVELLVVIFVRNCQTVFQSGCMISHSHQQCMRVSFAPYPPNILYCKPLFETF